MDRQTSLHRYAKQRDTGGGQKNDTHVTVNNFFILQLLAMQFDSYLA